MKKVYLFIVHLILSVSSLIVYSKVLNSELDITYSILTIATVLFGVTNIPKAKNLKLYFITQAIVTILLSIAIYYLFVRFKI